MDCVPWARRLAAFAIVLPVTGMVLVVTEAAPLLGVLLVGSGIPLGIAGWIVLGRPIRHKRAPGDLPA